MIYSLSPFNAYGDIDNVPSKSYAHRIIILSALSKGQTLIKNVGTSFDVQATIDCMQKLGAKIERNGDNLIVNGIEKYSNNIELDFNESGSTMRFLIAIIGALGINAKFTGKGKLLSRPMEELYSVLQEKNVVVKDNCISGKLQGGVFKIDSSISSQFISGLIFASPLTGQDCVIELQGEVVSKNYIDISLQVAKEFGIDCEFENNVIKIYKGSGYRSLKEYQVEGDWSSAAFPLAMGALSGEVSVKNLNLNSLQGDAKIFNIMKEMGVDIKINGEKITAKKSQIKSANIDISNVPDMAPILSVLMSCADGTSTLIGVDRLKYKESDRLSAIMENLNRAKIKTECKNNVLKIFGGKSFGANFLGFNDHRIVMSSCVLSCVTQGKSSITDIEAVNKSYPEFFNHFMQLGGKINVDI